MEIDNIIEGHLIKIRESVKNTFGVDLTVNEVLDLVDTQFDSTLIAMKEGRPIKLNYLGTFKVKKGLLNAKESRQELRERGIKGAKYKEILQARAEIFLGEIKIVRKQKQL